MPEAVGDAEITELLVPPSIDLKHESDDQAVNQGIGIHDQLVLGIEPHDEGSGSRDASDERHHIVFDDERFELQLLRRVLGGSGRPRARSTRAVAPSARGCQG